MESNNTFGREPKRTRRQSYESFMWRLLSWTPNDTLEGVYETDMDKWFPGDDSGGSTDPVPSAPPPRFRQLTLA